ncbi:MAG TPA: dTDP-4-dehydrorhamnose reductase [Terriglobales bacterium]|nr:dTDP-4-dehydrorhamnose reductase [Terriglobales bacterium]
MKLLILGANGQLGSDLCRLAAVGHEVVAMRHADLDVRDAAAIGRALAAHRPEAVINTSAFHKVEVCEQEAESAFAVNAIAVLNLARACAEAGAALVHFSTDYVFDGAKGAPYVESDLPAPVNVYGASKAAGELLARAFCPKHFVIRTTGLYGKAGSNGKGGNFVETMLRKARAGEAIRVVHDQVLTPTYTVDLAAKVLELLGSGRYGLYHVTSEGQCSWYDFAAKIFELSGLRPDLQPVSSAEFRSPVRRPAYSVLAKAGLRAIGLAPPPAWPDALARYLREPAR